MNSQWQVSRKYVSFSILIVIALLFVMVLTTQADDGPAITSNSSNGLDDNNSPIRALAAMDKIPLLNEPVEISCTLNSVVAAPDSTAQIELPATAKVVSGDVNWQGNLVAGKPVTFAVTVEFDTEGDTAVACRVHKQLDAENSYGDLATLYVAIGREHSIEGFAPVPISDQIRVGAVLESGDGVLAPETADQWQWNYEGRTVPAPPSVKPSLTETTLLSDDVEVVLGDLTVTGTWSYFDRDDSFVGVREQLVEIVRGDNGDHLAWCYTGLAGSYSCGPFSNPGAAGVRSIIHSYSSYNPNPDLLIVKNPDFSGTAPANSFRVQTGVVVLSDGTQDIGSWYVYNDDSYERAYWSQRDLVDTWRHIFFFGDVSGSTSGPSTVLWKIDSTDGAYYVIGGEVHLKGEDPISDTVVIHEYTHNIMYTVYTSYPSRPNCNPHTIQGQSSQGCAWTEGWAEFIPSVVNNDPTYRWASGASLNLENPTWTTSGWDDGDDVEGRVVGSLWDMYDPTNEGDDQYTEPADFAPFWDIFYNQDDNNFSEYWQAWLSFGYDNSSAGPLMSMYQSTIDYRLGPGNDDFADAYTVGSVPYTVNNWDTSNATTQGNDPDHPCGSVSTPKQSRSVWYKFTPGSSAQYNINTVGSTYNTTLSVWTGSFGSLANVACDDDGGGGVQSSLDVNLTSGTTYYIEASSFGNGNGGMMDLSISGPTALLSIEPTDVEVPLNGEATVDIVASNITGLFAIEVELHFDPAYVEVVGAQVTPGSCPVPDFVVDNSADNVNGTINYSVTSIAPSLPCDGGVVMSITFRGLALVNNSPLHFDSWLLSDMNGLPLPTNAQDGRLTVVDPVGTIEGTVLLQGRSDHSGAEVCADDGGTPVCVQTDASGAYSIGVPAGSYLVTVDMERYLDAEKPSVPVTASSVTLLSDVTCLGGDTNDDCTVNILDLALEGGRFNSSCGDPIWDPRADINNDCTVNILDLAVSGGNFGKSCPVPWPPSEPLD